LQFRVNDVQWHEAESLAALGPKDRLFLTRTDNDARLQSVRRRDRGVRLPTGVENVSDVPQRHRQAGQRQGGTDHAAWAPGPLGVKRR